MCPFNVALMFVILVSPFISRRCAIGPSFKVVCCVELFWCRDCNIAVLGLQCGCYCCVGWLHASLCLCCDGCLNCSCVLLSCMLSSIYIIPSGGVCCCCCVPWSSAMQGNHRKMWNKLTLLAWYCNYHNFCKSVGICHYKACVNLCSYSIII